FPLPRRVVRQRRHGDPVPPAGGGGTGRGQVGLPPVVGIDIPPQRRNAAPATSAGAEKPPDEGQHETGTTDALRGPEPSSPPKSRNAGPRGSRDVAWRRMNTAVARSGVGREEIRCPS